MLKSFLFAILLAITATYAQTLAVLEITPSSEDANLTVAEFRHLTDELRTQAREALPRNYSVLTRDNIISLLPPEEEQMECLSESCAVVVGRAIGAEYVTQGFIGSFQGMLTLTIELYESMSGNMLGSFVTESEDARGLLGTIRARAPSLFARIQPSLPEPSPTTPHSPLPTPQKNHTPFFVALTLDILGAAAIGFGIYQYFNINKMQTDYRKMPVGELPENEEAWRRKKTEELNKINDAKTKQKIAYGVGSALLATGIAVHIWF
ncbi:MAG: hypothetical protein LBC85_06335 [Fibromonadaceae bacterium]|jgi:hypothetical protein|nr:hypothetical protein [Fibromonadaceae bacterium]